MRFLDSFTFDSVASRGIAYTDNDFEVVISESDWLAEPIEYGHYLFELDTEWGGRVEGIAHIGSDIKLTGPTWRGMLARKIVKPTTGQAYLTIASQDANTAISTLLGALLGTLFRASPTAYGVAVSQTYRYDNLLQAINDTLDAIGARLAITFDGAVATLSAAAIVDQSEAISISQDYTAPIRSTVDYARAYNHVIALGRGDMAARTVLNYYRSDDGAIDTTPITDPVDDRMYVLDYPNAEDNTVLANAAIAKLEELVPQTSVEIDLTGMDVINLGDIVGGMDRITGLSLTKPITQIIRTVSADGDTYQYKAGD